MSTKNYGFITSLDELSKLFSKLIKDNKPIAFDIETGYHGEPRDGFALHPETAIVVGFSFANSTDWARYVPLAHDIGANLDNYEVAKLFWPVLKTGLGVAHNARFEMRHLSKWFRDFLWDDPDHGKEVQESNGYFPVRSDTMIEAYIVSEYKSFGLKFLSDVMFGHKMTELYELFADLPKNKRKTLRFNVLDLNSSIQDYACEDALWCLAIHQKYYPKVKDHLLYKVEMEILQVLCDMEDYGVKYDWAFYRRAADRGKVFLEKMNKDIQAELSEMVGHQVSVNLGSPAQIGDILYGKLGMKTTRFTKATKNSGDKKMSTDAIALAGLAKQYPVVKRILQWKEMRVLLNRYLDKYEKEYAYADDGMAHPNHMQCAVISGRFAVSDPPYQQSPKKYHYELNTGEVFELNFRDGIIAPKDHYIIGFDYSQQELRAFAGEAQEQGLIDAFNNGEDIHSKTASMMLGIPIEQVGPDERKIGKTLNFGVVFGMQAASLAERLVISKEEAKTLLDQYFAAYPSIAVWSERQVQFGRSHGYVESRFGRHIPIWEFESTDRWIYQKGERLCVNAIIQGSGTGDVPKIAMVRVHKAIKKAGLQDKIHLAMNIHDALEFYVHRSIRPEDVIKLLEPAVIFSVPGWPKMEAEWHIGVKWGSVKEIRLNENGELVVEGVKVVETNNSGLDEEGEGGDMPELPQVDTEALRAFIKAPKKEDSAPGPHSCTEGPGSEGKCVVCGLKANKITHAEKPVHIDPPVVIAPVVQTPVDEDPKKVIVEITDMPEDTAFRRFLMIMRDKPGKNTVKLRTPEGDLDLGLNTGISPNDQAQISMIIGGAKVYYAPDDIDVSALSVGLKL